MKQPPESGLSALLTVTVTEDMRPVFYGQVIHDVMSTVSMMYYMELAGREVLLPLLEDSEEGAGLGMDVKHFGPAVVGQEVRIRATCIELTPKRLICEVIAETDENIVGKGTFIQAVFQKQELQERIDKLREKLSQRQQV
ncbi:thioesterase [Paenibacillus sp. N1-5-1-14]|uniref:thioesterase family protein n=1 Tax=Paenibacillus radicibacter TaxID=2972488 RepID=UPI002159AE79|nr:hotdog domain-containing protein [Paenibacillus radicibacter]MCR8641816.1 thioesterase [Paenibacillus radicibacter]